ncbi:hypothetical protein [Candidatus Methylobacter oryzae]|uniref:Uncharacterized protein n=1 Tax=Candidatus Methylobacter oryzae TaxID=2497749 RepID=A0ABY3CE70_9GAMM|nr:hypothetical protein [Candidatus Methylobacter oryzae]TRX00309.1 hypothetical protein EKO24_006180 [Candidatus Methylobacter oryzae]
MAKLITGTRIRADRAEKLRDKAFDLMLKTKERITETDLINYLIDNYVDRFDADQNGIFIKEENE